MSRLSVVLPACNEEPMVEKTCRTLRELLGQAGIFYELVLVDDGSSDGTWAAIEKVSREDKNVTGVHFSRNFGKEAAIVAGLAQACGDAVAVMDCDLQHPPEILLEMYRLWEQGYEVVEGIKKNRGKETLFHRKSAGFFYRIMSRATGFDMENASDFKLLDRKAVESVLAMPERSMFFRAASSWIGFKSISVPFEVQEREAGESKWSAGTLIIYNTSAAVCNSRCRGLLWVLPAPSGLFSGPVFFRACGGRLYHASDRDALYWKCCDDEPWDHRILYRQDL